MTRNTVSPNVWARYVTNSLLVRQDDRDRYIMEPTFHACVDLLVRDLLPQALEEIRKVSDVEVEETRARLKAIMEETPPWYLRKDGKRVPSVP